MTERGAIQKLVRHAKAHGWSVPSVDDGGEEVPCKSEKDVLDTVFSVDMSRIYFEKEGNVHSALIVLGNSPDEVVADWGYSEGDADGFNAMMEALQL
jgi:hypothetical protein